MDKNLFEADDKDETVDVDAVNFSDAEVLAEAYEIVPLSRS